MAHKSKFSFQKSVYTADSAHCNPARNYEQTLSWMEMADAVSFFCPAHSLLYVDARGTPNGQKILKDIQRLAMLWQRTLKLDLQSIMVAVSHDDHLDLLEVYEGKENSRIRRTECIDLAEFSEDLHEAFFLVKLLSRLKQKRLVTVKLWYPTEREYQIRRCESDLGFALIDVLCGLGSHTKDSPARKLAEQLDYRGLKTSQFERCRNNLHALCLGITMFPEFINRQSLVFLRNQLERGNPSAARVTLSHLLAKLRRVALPHLLTHYPNTMTADAVELRRWRITEIWQKIRPRRKSPKR